MEHWDAGLLKLQLDLLDYWIQEYFISKFFFFNAIKLNYLVDD